jgi:hypothetical protein
MGKTHLLQAVCTVAMLAAVPALAQRPEAGMTGPNGTPNPVVRQPDQQTAQNNANTPAANPAPGGSSPSATDDQSSPTSHPMHHSRHRGAAMRGAGDSQNAAVDRLNDQSFQAAQQGQSFGGGADSGSPSMAAPPPAPMGAGGAPGGAMAPAPGSTTKP